MEKSSRRSFVPFADLTNHVVEEDEDIFDLLDWKRNIADGAQEKRRPIETVSVEHEHCFILSCSRKNPSVGAKTQM